MTQTSPEPLPDALGELLAARLQRLREAGVDAAELEAEPEALARVLIGSDFVADWLAREPGRLALLRAEGLTQSAPDRGTLRRSLAEAIAALPAEMDPAAPEGPLGELLRRFRNLQQVGIIWRDLTGASSQPDTLRMLSDLAEVVLDESLRVLHETLASTHGEPRDDQGTALRLVVLALGKLGAAELNLSSDVDLVFAYPAPGETDTGLTAQEFFLRLGRQLIGLLDQRTSVGFVFRVDMRLRPFGDSGPLVQHFDALLGYYEEQGRDWERYALIKARPVAGDLDGGRQLLRGLRPFVFRRYLDFGAIESLRQMKTLLRREVRRKRLHNNVKQGEGGIREVEFVVQVFQIIHGGRDVRFQQPGVRHNLGLLADNGLLERDDIRQLEAAYGFLRDVEHRLQALQDEQTQQLPRDEILQARLAWSMGYADWADFSAALQSHREHVSAEFNALIEPVERDDDDEQDDSDRWQELWPELGPEAVEALREVGLKEPDAAVTRLRELQDRRDREIPQEIGRQRLDAVMPRLLALVAEGPEPDQALTRSLRLVEAVLRRTAYLVLLVENPQALTQLVRLCRASDWIAGTLARHPILVDELLDPRSLYTAPTRETLRQELVEQLRGVPEDDLEQQMEQLRYFKEATELRVAACELDDILPMMKVSDALTWLAETIIEQVAAMAWQHTVAQFGRPCDTDGQPVDDAFAVVGYGKVGGYELGWGSDLDLVFLHDLPLEGSTDGSRSVINGQFFARLGQRLIHLLTTRTHTGELYDVDMRLRPSGQAGVLVSPLAAFRRYQFEDAWTWEHQALVRARVVTGSEVMQQRFDAIRGEVLAQPRNREQLRDEVASMRQRILREKRRMRSRPHAGELSRRHSLHLKLDPGAVVDIEFMVQYLVLGWACEHPELLRHTDGIRILETAESEGLLPAETAGLLIESYKELRAEVHRRTLENLPAQTDRDDLITRANTVAAIWQDWMEPPEPEA